MKTMIGSAALVLSIAAFTPAFASDPFEEGRDAALASDYETAFEKWQPLAIEGHGDAMFDLALMYHAGLHVEQNEAIAVRLYHLAAEAGNQMAQEYLAAGYENGWFGLPRSEELAAYWQGKAEPVSEEVAVIQNGNAEQS